ncbi:MAG: hypothetical protein K6V97_10945 [Actinomycetia bacterium]|nr:hypothetical protein [Actinomycetes bacterium]
MAVEQPRLQSYAVSLAAAPDLAERLDIRGVPVLFVGDRRFDGPLPEWVLVQQLELADRR